MPFFLLGKDPDDSLSLISEDIYPSAAEARTALARISARPGFDRWDDEVFVMDLTSGKSLMLVRPETAEEPEPEPEVEPVAEEPEVEAAVESEPEIEPEPEVELEPEPEPEPEPEVAEEDADLAAVIEDLASEDEQTSGAGLRDALRRTAEHMASQGIIPPESVGPAEEAPVEEAAELAEPEQRAADASNAPAWPWDTGVAMAELGLGPLDEPERGLDNGSLVRSPGDDDTVAASRTVVLGAYADTPVSEPLAESEPPAHVVEFVAGSAVEQAAAPVVEAGTVEFDESQAVPVMVPVASPEPVVAPESDFIDLGGVQAVTSDAESGYSAPAAVADTSCNDCVYVETCPNKDQLDPASCGSFQWR